jgi:hypothetical protein
MREILGARLWRAAYRRRVRIAFATVPFYRGQWALFGRTDPILVPERTGVNGGAVGADEALRRIVDLVPLAGGTQTIDPARGLGRTLTAALGSSAARGLVVLLDAQATQPPVDLPASMRGCLIDPADATASGAHEEVRDALRRGDLVLAVGDDKELGQLAANLPEELVALLHRMPRRRLDQLDGGPFGLIHDPLLGYLGALGQCGRWHLDQRAVYARQTDAGLAFTLLHQDSPSLVDILVQDGRHARLDRCPRHGSPVVRR